MGQRGCKPISYFSVIITGIRGPNGRQYINKNYKIIVKTTIMKPIYFVRRSPALILYKGSLRTTGARRKEVKVSSEDLNSSDSDREKT